jgi:xanthine phosphoribosyltransferase
MDYLKNKILTEGRVRTGNILKVDSFLNHQIDIELLNEIGKEFKKRFEDDRVNKILTIEASGIAVASIAAQYFENPRVVFGKKTESLNLDNELFSTEVHSFTKNKTYNVMVAKRFLNPGDKVLILDDFLANGCAALGLIDLARQAGAEVVGVGIVIEKGFQTGRKEIEKQGIRVESLAIIENMENNKVRFKDIQAFA